MRSFLLVIALISAASAAPFVIPFLGSRDNSISIRTPASENARAIASTDFALIAFSTVGCARNVSHAQVSDVPDGESADIEGLITFGNITMSGETCGSGAEDDITKLYDDGVLEDFGLSFDCGCTVIIGGVDLAVRTCGSFGEDSRRRYAFSKDIKRLLPSLSEAGLIDNSTISDGILDDEVLWMVSAPLDGTGRVCLYKEVVERDDPGPTNTPDPIESSSAGSSENEESSAAEDEESSAAEDEESSAAEDEASPGDMNSDEDEESNGAGTGIFGDANAEAIALEEQEANQERACFPGSARVHLEDGTIKLMAQLEIGDRVMVAPNVFSEVFMFTHKMSSGRHSFVEILTSTGQRLALTKGHYLYVSDKLAAASTVREGDNLALSDGTSTTVQHVRSIMSTGLYNPQTLEGTIIVNGVKTSTYTTAVEPSIAHALLAPLRALFSQLHLQTAYFDSGADSLVRMVPKGQATH